MLEELENYKKVFRDNNIEFDYVIFDSRILLTIRKGSNSCGFSGEFAKGLEFIQRKIKQIGRF